MWPMIRERPSGKDQNKLLIIDDEENMRHMLTALLSREGYQIDSAAHGRDALAKLATDGFDLVLCDVRMPDMDGMAFLRAMQEKHYSATVIMMSAYGSVDMALEAMKLGAYDFISKPFKKDEVLLTLRKAEERERLRHENQELKALLQEGAEGFTGMVVKSGAMQETCKLAARVARYDTTVLITGESGTGKELLARGIHQLSDRAGQPLVPVNCGAIPDNLLESELFGHVKGAFTDAHQDKPGLFREAENGFLFLDEIGELPLAMQVKLLRVLQEQEIRPVGGSGTVRVNARIIAATARDLRQEVQAGRFREDLYYRLNVISLTVPPLRERPADIPALADYFLRQYKHKFGSQVEDIAPKAMNLLLAHSWPGNVRELENVMERAVVLADKKTILPENLPPELGGRNQGRRLDDIFSSFSLKKAQKILEERLISRALEATGGNKSRAAELLEISYPSLLSKIKEYNIGS